MTPCGRKTPLLRIVCSHLSPERCTMRLHSDAKPYSFGAAGASMCGNKLTPHCQWTCVGTSAVKQTSYKIQLNLPITRVIENKKRLITKVFPRKPQTTPLMCLTTLTIKVQTVQREQGSCCLSVFLSSVLLRINQRAPPSMSPVFKGVYTPLGVPKPLHCQ